MNGFALLFAIFNNDLKFFLSHLENMRFKIYFDQNEGKAELS